MKTLLRSTIVVAPGDDRDLFFRNYLALSDSKLGFDVTEDSVLWTFVQDFTRTHNHIPDQATVRSHFTRNGESEVVDRLSVLATLPPAVRGDFIKRLEDKAHDRRQRQVQEVLREAATILTVGAEIREGKEKKILRGPIDAVRFVVDRSHDIVAPTLGARLSGEVTGDGADFADEYQRVKSDPLAGVGQNTGISQPDVALNGAKRHELWIHAAFTSHMKSTFMLNWVYNQAVYYRQDSVLFSLEMPYQQCRRILYAIHSIHEKFKPIRYKMGLQSDPNSAVGIPYGNIRDGTLDAWNPRAEEFLLKYVIPDFNDATNGYGKIHIEVSDPDKSDFSVADLKAKAELIHSKSPFALLFVDHVGLMAPRKWVPSTTERLNEVIRDLKRLAMSFNRGQGMAVVALFQINREGFKAAMKSKEKMGRANYDLTHLSYANEAERSADIVTTTWLDEDLKKENRVLFQCLKSRDQEGFEPFLARVEWPCRRLLTCFDLPVAANANNPQQRAAQDKRLTEAEKELDLA